MVSDSLKSFANSGTTSISSDHPNHVVLSHPLFKVSLEVKWKQRIDWNKYQWKVVPMFHNHDLSTALFLSLKVGKYCSILIFVFAKFTISGTLNLFKWGTRINFRLVILINYKGTNFVNKPASFQIKCL